MGKFCMKCGNPLQEGHKFCLNCGAPAAQENAKTRIVFQDTSMPLSQP